MTRVQPEGIVVLGAPRSGTTLVRRLLDAHPDICCPPETNLLVSAARFIAEDRTAGGVGVGVLSGLGFSGIAPEETLQRLREFVFGFLREIADRAGCTLWAEKTAFAAFHLDAIQKLCQDQVRYVLVTRHPLDCISSQKELADKMEIYLPEFHALIRNHRSPYVGLAEGWARVNRDILTLAADRPDSSILVRYEDLVSRPEDTLTRIFSFLERPTDVQQLVAESFKSSEEVGLGDWKTYATKQIHEHSIGRWQKLSWETIRSIVPIVAKLAAELNHELPDIGEELDEEEARHRFQLSLMAAQMRADMREK